MIQAPQKTKEQLTTERIQLIEMLRGNFKDDGKETLALLKENETALKCIDRQGLIRNVNNKYTRLRELGRQAYECEQPSENITCADGSFHKTKVKKYPKIAKLQYAYAKWGNNRITRLTINGEKFEMYQSNYEYGKETTYTRPETFEAFLNLNTIPIEDITIQQYNEMAEKLKALNDQLKADIERYKNGLSSLNYHSLSYWGLIGQHSTHLYEYTPNK